MLQRKKTLCGTQYRLQGFRHRRPTFARAPQLRMRRTAKPPRCTVLNRTEPTMNQDIDTQLPADRLPSAPNYGVFAPCGEAHFHLLVVQHGALDAAAPHLAHFAPHAARLLVLTMEHADPIGTLDAFEIETRCCETEAALADELLRAFGNCAPGTRLYIAGDEAFIWRIQHRALAAGLERDEIAAMAIGATRAVYCVHCASTRDYAARDMREEKEMDDSVTCLSCGVRLAVRGHFSERLGAWLAVCADADHPYAQERA